MLHNKRNIILAIVLSIIFVILVGILLLILNSTQQKNENLTNNNSENNIQKENSNINSDMNEGANADILWMFTGDGYKPSGKIPSCADPLNMPAPVNLSNVTSILYPGQTRGGNYKPHGGFRFDNSRDNKVDINAPLEAVVVNGARYIAEGEIQYTFDFITPCGLMYRLGHLRELTGKFQAIADTFPEAVEGDSRTTEVNPRVRVSSGELIATKIGIISQSNTFVDFGVYNLNEKNKISSDSNWLSDTQHQNDLAQHAVCWFDLLSSNNNILVRSLPAGDPTSGKNSDYCE